MMKTEHLMNNYGTRSRTMVRGQGVYLYDDAGEEYLDFCAGIAVCSLGHAHPGVTTVLSDQATQLIHCSNLFLIPQQADLATKLCSISHFSRALFCNSGAEANEAALKLARRYASARDGNRTKLISLPGSFHGRTMGSLSLTPKKAYQAGYTPLLPHCVTPPSMEATLAEVDETTAAVFIEMIQGEGGVIPLSAAFVNALAARAKAVGALLVVDEVQTGVGRTGRFFAYEEYGIQPDIVTLAKGLANGVPIGAILATEEVAAAFTPGSHGTTFGGNPLSTAVANYVVREVSDEKFLSHVRRMGRVLERGLRGLAMGVTGRGLMWGMDMPDAKAYVEAAAKNGVLLTTAGETRVRWLPPLIVQEHQIEEALRRVRHI